MTDDQDAQTKPTRRMDAVGDSNDEQRQVAARWGLGEESRSEIDVQQKRSEMETVREIPITAPADDDEKTELIDRDELMQHTEHDQKRGQNRHDKKTIPMDSPFATPNEGADQSPAHSDSRLDQTHEINLSEETTRPVVPTDHAQLTIDSTDEFARHGISTMEDEDKVTFPARIDGEVRIVVPPEVASEADIEPGDLVVVKIRKVE